MPLGGGKFRFSSKNHETAKAQKMKEPKLDRLKNTIFQTVVYTGTQGSRVVRIWVPLNKEGKQERGYHSVEYGAQLRDYFGLGPLPRTVKV